MKRMEQWLYTLLFIATLAMIFTWMLSTSLSSAFRVHIAELEDSLRAQRQVDRDFLKTLHNEQHDERIHGEEFVLTEMKKMLAKQQHFVHHTTKHAATTVAEEQKTAKEKQKTESRIAVHSDTADDEPIMLPFAPHRIAIIVPFIGKETNDVVKMLNRWRAFVPFVSTKPRYAPFVDLIFYFHRSRREHTSSSIRALQDASKSLFVQQLFLYANLTDAEDKYPMGANHMFYRLFSPSIFKQLKRSYRSFCLMETDVVAIRRGWADKVYEETLGDTFFMKGSQFRGRYLPKHLRFHINGNALYGVNESFADILERVKNAFPISMGYDGSIYAHLLSEGGWRDFRDFAHYFQFSDFIMNLYWTEFSMHEVLRENPNTFFIHGGNNTDGTFDSRKYQQT